MPGLDVRRAEPELLGAVRALVDEVFAASRGSLALASRFPHVLTEANAANVFVGLVAGRVVATVATRLFTWHRGESSGRAAMVGLVATHPAHRRRGIGTAVLRAAAAGLAEDGASSVVLWATRPAIYEPLGFRLEDPGALGTIRGRAGGRGLPAPEPVDPAWLDALRNEPGALRVERAGKAWAAVPPPSDEVVVYRTERAYALAGRTATASYLYELVGDPEDFGRLFEALRRDADAVFVNDTPGTSSHRRLHAAGVEWQAKPLGMWLRLAPGAATGLYVPYFDRI
jgi:predicted N-acetyltransferase YhbS